MDRIDEQMKIVFAVANKLQKKGVIDWLNDETFIRTWDECAQILARHERSLERALERMAFYYDNSFHIPEHPEYEG